MRRTAQFFAALSALLAAALLFTNLQSIDDPSFIEPLILAPFVGAATAMWFLSRNQLLAGLSVSIGAFAVCALLWLVQQAPAELVLQSPGGAG